MCYRLFTDVKYIWNNSYLTVYYYFLGLNIGKAHKSMFYGGVMRKFAVSQSFFVILKIIEKNQQ